MKKCIIKILKKTFAFVNSAIPKKNNRIIFKSVPDFSGNCKALSEYITQNEKNYEVIWLHKSSTGHVFDNSDIKIISMKGISWLYYFMTSKHIATTHNEMVGIKSRQQNYISLWHGMPFKKICYLADNEVDYMEDYSAKRIATSEIMKAIIASAFHEKANNVLITGQPRNDFLFEKKSLNMLGFEYNPNEKIIVYAPTYRHNKHSEKYSNGNKIEGDNIFRFTDANLSNLNDLFKKHSIRLLVKLHPFEENTLNKNFEHSNINIIKSEDLKRSNLDINHLLFYADCLLTDYSSTYIDYLILNRPIGFVIPDYSSYQNSRGGFTLEPAEYWMPGKKIQLQSELSVFIESVFSNNLDEFKMPREIVNKMLNTYTKNNSERVFNAFIGGQQ